MRALVINKEDLVAVALTELKKGEAVSLFGSTVTLLDDIPRGHKFALCDIKKGEDIIKYGCPIGHAKEDIYKGQHVHTQNVCTLSLIHI